MWATLVGLIFTLVLAFTLIPLFGYIGAAITASISYISTIVYQYIVFRKTTKTQFIEWIPGKKDLTDFVLLIKSALKKTGDDSSS